MLRHITGKFDLGPIALVFFVDILLPRSFSHIVFFVVVVSDQPPLEPNESGPIGLILAPARELAYQIHLVCKSFTKSLGLK